MVLMKFCRYEEKRTFCRENLHFVSTIRQWGTISFVTKKFPCKENPLKKQRQKEHAQYKYKTQRKPYFVLLIWRTWKSTHLEKKRLFSWIHMTYYLTYNIYRNYWVVPSWLLAMLDDTMNIKCDKNFQTYYICIVISWICDTRSRTF